MREIFHVAAQAQFSVLQIKRAEHAALQQPELKFFHRLPAAAGWRTALELVQLHLQFRVRRHFGGTRNTQQHDFFDRRPAVRRRQQKAVVRHAFRARLPDIAGEHQRPRIIRRAKPADKLVRLNELEQRIRRRILRGVGHVD